MDSSIFARPVYILPKDKIKTFQDMFESQPRSASKSVSRVLVWQVPLMFVGGIGKLKVY